MKIMPIAQKIIKAAEVTSIESAKTYAILSLTKDPIEAVTLKFWSDASEYILRNKLAKYLKRKELINHPQEIKTSLGNPLNTIALSIVALANKEHKGIFRFFANDMFKKPYN